MEDANRFTTASPELLIQLHVAEYQALANRGTYYVVLMASIAPVIVLYLALIFQLWKPTTGSLEDALNGLLRTRAERAFMFWGNLLIVQAILTVWGQFLVEQYKIVHYIETALRCAVSSVLGTDDLLSRTSTPAGQSVCRAGKNHPVNSVQIAFWGYEQFLRRNRASPFATAWEWIWTLIAAVIITSLTLLWLMLHLTWSWLDLIGLVLNLLAWWCLCSRSLEAQETRHAWESFWRNRCNNGSRDQPS